MKLRMAIAVLLVACCFGLYGAQPPATIHCDGLYEFPTLNQFETKGHGLYCGYYALFAAKCVVEGQRALRLNRVLFDACLEHMTTWVKELRGRDNAHSLQGAEIDALIKRMGIEDNVVVIDSLTFLRQLIRGAQFNDVVFDVIQQCKVLRQPIAFIVNTGEDRADARRVTHWVAACFWPQQTNPKAWMFGLYDSASHCAAYKITNRLWIQDLCRLCFSTDVHELAVQAPIVAFLDSLLANYENQLTLQNQLQALGSEAALNSGTRGVLIAQRARGRANILENIRKLGGYCAEHHISEKQFLSIVNNYCEGNCKYKDSLNEIFETFFHQIS